MTREEIEKIGSVGPYCFKTDREKRWYEIGCIEGLAAADEEPNLERIWHDAREEPEIHKMFLAQIGDDVFETFVMYVDKNQYWKNWSNDVNIKMWAYIDDLLPKGGKK